MTDHGLRFTARRPLLFQFLAQFRQPWMSRFQFGGAAGGSGARTAAAGASLFVCGLISITTPLWASADHVFKGYNLVNVLQLPLMVGGVAMVVAGFLLMVVKRWPRIAIRPAHLANQRA